MGQFVSDLTLSVAKSFGNPSIDVMRPDERSAMII